MPCKSWCKDTVAAALEYAEMYQPVLHKDPCQVGLVSCKRRRRAAPRCSVTPYLAIARVEQYRIAFASANDPLEPPVAM